MTERLKSRVPIWAWSGAGGMESRLISAVHRIKVSALSRGISVSPGAAEALSEHGRTPLTIHEYATTGGVTMELPGQVFLNAPFDEPYCADAEARLEADEMTGGFRVDFGRDSVPVRMLKLPGYLDALDEKGRRVTDTVMSHGDRLRISIVSGCAYSCGFCDLAATKYVKRPEEQFLSAIRIARMDPNLPIKHLLLSGGTTNRSDQPYFESICRAVLESSDIPVDIMMTPRPEVEVLERLVDWGLFGFSLNLEIYDPKIAARIIPQKARLGHSTWERSIARATELTGGNGRVRSLLVVGLEPRKETLEGVEFLARLGCDPVLSPFRPSRGTALVSLPPPDVQFLEDIYEASSVIARQYGVLLGPRCIPCQHNTLTFPEGSSAYYSS